MPGDGKKADANTLLGTSDPILVCIEACEWELRNVNANMHHQSALIGAGLSLVDTILQIGFEQNQPTCVVIFVGRKRRILNPIRITTQVD